MHVHDENNDLGRFDRDLHLVERGLLDLVHCFLAAQQADAAGVHQLERPSVPLGLGADAIARDAGPVVHDGNAPPGDAIEQRGLADIRPANNGDQA